MIRVFPNCQLNHNKIYGKNLHALTIELNHKDELIQLLKNQLNDKQKDNDFLKEQLIQVNTNFTQLNNLIENKTINKRKRKFMGIF